VIQAFGHAPRTRLAAPGALRFAQAGDERTRILVGCLELVFERFGVSAIRLGA
jgi:hypothetical protein